MKRSRFLVTLLLFAAGIASTAIFLRAQELSRRPDRIRVTVTVQGTKQNPHPVLTKEDVIVFQEKDRRPVLSWVAAKDDCAGLDFAILVDDSLDTSIGNQFGDLTEFIRSLPSTARVGIAYASFGRAKFVQNFTSDHEQAAKALRLPMGNINSGSSIFMAAGDLAGKWPANTNRHEVLLVSDGIDTFYGTFESQPGSNPSLQQAINKAQRYGVTFYAIYANGAAHLHRQFFLINNGQGCLTRLTYETGGEAYFQGFETPLAFKPFLQELSGHLGDQYVLTFGARLGKKSGYQRLRLNSEINGVEFLAPDRVYIPALKE